MDSTSAPNKYIFVNVDTAGSKMDDLRRRVMKEYLRKGPHLKMDLSETRKKFGGMRPPAKTTSVVVVKRLRTAQDPDTLGHLNPLYSSSLPRASISLQLVDPFDVLPASGVFEQNDLFRWSQRRPSDASWEDLIPWLNNLDRTYIKDFWSVAQDHKGLSHILLSIGKARLAALLGSEDRPSYLYDVTAALMRVRKYISGKLTFAVNIGVFQTSH